MWRSMVLSLFLSVSVPCRYGYLFSGHFWKSSKILLANDILSNDKLANGNRTIWTWRHDTEHIFQHYSFLHNGLIWASITVSSTVMLSAVFFIVMLSVITLIVVILNIVKLSDVAPRHLDYWSIRFWTNGKDSDNQLMTFYWMTFHSMINRLKSQWN